MKSSQRALVTLALAGALAPATSAARPQAASRHIGCIKTYMPARIRHAILATYSGTRHVTRSERQMLRRMRRCDRWPSTRTSLLRLNRQARAAWLLRIHPPLPYGLWAIPPAIVMCESTGQNLPPNSAGASGYYQIIPGTWSAYGGDAYASQAYLAPKIDQDIIAGKIWDGGAGAQQWTCAGIVGW